MSQSSPTPDPAAWMRDTEQLIGYAASIRIIALWYRRNARHLLAFDHAARAVECANLLDVLAHPSALPATTPSDPMTTIMITTTPGLAMLGGCDCYGKAPTVPVYRDRMNHLNDCPAKGSGYPVGTMRAHVPATPSDDGASLIAAERHRQPDDDETLVGGELVDSAILLIDQARGGNIEWTGEPLACARKLAARHTGDQVRLLTIAGAFLAAEIDRLRRVSPSEGSAPDTPEPEDDDDLANQVALQVLCRVFDDGVDVAMDEWRAFNAEGGFFWWARARDAFIRGRLDDQRVPPSAPDTKPDETAEIEQRVASLAALKPNWNSYGAPPIAPIALDRARALIAALRHAPDLVPANNGGVQLDWHRDGFEIEISIDEHGVIDDHCASSGVSSSPPEGEDTKRLGDQ